MNLLFRVNLGGEGEVPGVLNQNGPWIVKRGWRASQSRKTLWQLVKEGHQFLICENTSLPIADGTVDEVITTSLPRIDSITHLGPTVQTSEIRRILKPGGRWIHEGQVEFVKP